MTHFSLSIKIIIWENPMVTETALCEKNWVISLFKHTCIISHTFPVKQHFSCCSTCFIKHSLCKKLMHKMSEHRTYKLNIQAVLYIHNLIPEKKKKEIYEPQFTLN